MARMVLGQNGYLLTLFIVIFLEDVFSFPAVSRSEYPTYTSKLITEIFDKYSIELKQQKEPIRELVEMLVQVALQQQNRLDILQGGQLSQRKEVTELSMEATYLKKYITERFRYYHNDAAGDPARNTLGKTTNLFLPYDNYFKERTELVVDDIIAMNDSIVGLSLRVDTLDRHLEEVEAVVLDVKRATVDDFTDVINTVIPILLQQIEDKYTAVNKIDRSLYERVLKAGEIITREAKIRSTPQTTACEAYDCTNITAVSVTKNNITDSTPVTRVTVSSQNYTRESLSALYEQPVSYIRRVRESFVVRVITGYRRKLIGSWMQDGYLKTSKVWSLQGYRKLTHLVEYSNLLTFADDDVYTAYTLTYECGGTGHVVYNATFYCHAFKSNKIYRFDLITFEWNLTRLPGSEVHSSHSYTPSSLFNDVDILSDFTGIWVLYTNKESLGYMVLLKLNPQTLDREYNVTLNMKQEKFMNCFMTEGTLYCINSRNVDDSERQHLVITPVWSAHQVNTDILDKKIRAITMAASSKDVVLSADFNHRHMRLYTWNLVSVDRAKLMWYEFDLFQ